MATTPHLRTLTAHPTPILGGYPSFFFHQNDRKGCKRDVLDARGHIFCVFVRPETNRQGGGNHPLGRTRVKQKQNVILLSKAYHRS